eukprot:GHVU01023785.1.p2 GENE.GHVU01023785.1~~GHVU01023785.1.p2  ORF type:complete len:123 (-),score=9.05 GHVU01023785.1:641-1009(-)
MKQDSTGPENGGFHQHVFSWWKDKGAPDSDESPDSHSFSYHCTEIESAALPVGILDTCVHTCRDATLSQRNDFEGFFYFCIVFAPPFGVEASMMPSCSSRFSFHFLSKGATLALGRPPWLET